VDKTISRFLTDASWRIFRWQIPSLHTGMIFPTGQAGGGIFIYERFIQ
jgi:hypothetical protein